MRQYISIVVECRRMIQTNKQMNIYRVRSVNDRQNGRNMKKTENRTKHRTKPKRCNEIEMDCVWCECNLRNLFDLVVSHSNQQTAILFFYFSCVIYYCCYWFSLPFSRLSHSVLWIQVDLVSYFLMRMPCNNELLEEMNWHHIKCCVCMLIVNWAFCRSHRRTCCTGVGVAVCCFGISLCCSSRLMSYQKGYLCAALQNNKAHFVIKI